MAVSAVGTNLTFRMVRRLAGVVVLVFLVLGYLYGPAATPALRRLRDERVQRPRARRLPQLPAGLAGGRPSALDCWDASRPNKPDVDLGWWTDPFSS